MHDSYSLMAYMPAVFRALGTTLYLSWLSLILGALGGTLLALMRISGFFPLRWFAIVYTEFFRSVPILIILFFVFYGIPLATGIDLSGFWAATVALSAHASSMMSEVIRAGIESVGRGQWEAAQAAGMNYRQLMRHVVWPQAMQVILPPSVNIYIMVLKESSIASIIGFIELSRAGQLVNNATFQPFTVFIVVAAIYFALCYPLSLLSRRLERRLNVGRRDLQPA